MGIICRKDSGDFSFAKSSAKFEILWVKFTRNFDVYFIGSCYIPPSRSKRENAKDVLLELEVDISNFRK